MRFLLLLFLPFIAFAEGANQGYFELKSRFDGAKKSQPFRPPHPTPRAQSKDIDAAKALDGGIQTLDQIRKKHYKKIIWRNVRDGGLDQLLRSTDRHSYLLNPEHLKLWDRNYLAPGRAGVFFYKRWKDYPPWVIFTVPGSPAWKAGVRAGDAIMRVNGKSVPKMSVEMLRLMLRGQPGDKIRLEVIAEGNHLRSKPRLLELTLTQPARVRVQAKMVFSGVGYIALPGLSAGHVKELADHLEVFRRLKHSKVIIDLREAQGGTLGDINQSAALFLKKGQQLTTLKSKQGRIAQKVARDGPYQSMKLAVLVNARTEGAPEVLAGILKHYKKAVIVGGRTRGHASVQKLFRDKPEKGYATRLTVAQYLLPSGEAVDLDQKGLYGVKPDHLVNLNSKEALDWARQFYALRQGHVPAKPVNDKAIEKAIQFIQKS